jgi:hypothetical protein
MSLTEDQLLAHFPHASPAFLRANAASGGTAPAKIAPPAPAAVPAKRLRQDVRPLMNKLETGFFAYLTAQHPTTKIHPQAKRYRLGNGIWFKPDFVALLDGVETAWETKGPRAFRGGFENLKVAASLYPEIEWWLAWKTAGEWQLQRVLP